jgi:hypothetical protein
MEASTPQVITLLEAAKNNHDTGIHWQRVIKENASSLAPNFGLFDALLRLQEQFQNNKVPPLPRETRQQEETFQNYVKNVLNLEREPLTAKQALESIVDQTKNVMKNEQFRLLKGESFTINNQQLSLGSLVSDLSKVTTLQNDLAAAVNKLNDAMKELEENQAQIKQTAEEGLEKAADLADLKAKAEETINNVKDFADEVLSKLKEVDFLRDLEETKNKILQFLIQVAEKAIEIIEKLILVTIIAIIALTIAAAWSCGLAASALPALKSALKFLYDALKVVKQVHTYLKMALNFSWGDLIKLAADQIGLTDKINDLTSQLKIEEGIKDAIGNALEDTRLKTAAAELQGLAEKVLGDERIKEAIGVAKMCKGLLDEATQYVNENENQLSQKAASIPSVITDSITNPIRNIN